MRHWNTDEMTEWFRKEIPYEIVIKNVGPGGDYDSDELLIYPKSLKQNPNNFYKAIRVQAWDPENQKGIPNTGDMDFECISVCDGLDSSGGLNSSVPEIIQMYGDVMKALHKKWPDDLWVIRHYSEIF